MSLIDVLDKMEKLNIIANADNWIEFRAVRNKLTHEYQDNREDIIDGIKLAMIYFKEISDILQGITQYIQKNICFNAILLLSQGFKTGVTIPESQTKGYLKTG